MCCEVDWKRREKKSKMRNCSSFLAILPCDILISSDKGRCVSFKFSYTVTLSLKKTLVYIYSEKAANTSTTCACTPHKFPFILDNSNTL